jgi:hypothetical protein
VTKTAVGMVELLPSVLALVLAALALASGSLTALSLLVVAIVVLWAASTLRHLAHGSSPSSIYLETVCRFPRGDAANLMPSLDIGH